MIKKISAFSLISLTLILYINCVQGYSDQSSQIIKKISVEEADKLINERKDDPNLIILDVRTPDEYKTGHIKNSLNINFKSNNFKEEVDKLGKNNTYLVHCRSGKRSSKAIEIMRELNFREVYNMGGIIQWKEKGFEISE